MKSFASPLVLILCLAAFSSAGAQTDLDRLSQALDQAARYTYGGDAAPLRAIEELVAQSATAAAPHRDDVEQRLLDALVQATSADAKSFLCRQLAVISSARSVPLLEKLLADPSAAPMALHALAATPAPEAGTALQRSLMSATGTRQAAIVHAIAFREDRALAPLIIPLLNSPDPAVQEAAASALGALAIPTGIRALLAARPNAQGPFRVAINDALIAAAGRLQSENIPLATATYRRLYAADEPLHVRLAALRGLLQVSGEGATAELLNALRAPDSAFAANAAALVPELHSSAAALRIAEELPSFAPPVQVLVLHALAQNGDRSVAPHIAEAASSPDAAVRVAALGALAQAGDASAVEPLIRAATSGSREERQIAQASLASLHAPGTDDAILEILRIDEKQLQIAAMRAVSARKMTGAAGPLLALARSGDTTLRRPALEALATIVARDQLPAVVQLASSLPRADLNSLAETLGAAFQRLGPPEQHAPLLLAAIRTAPPEGLPSLVRLLNLTPSAEALAAVRDAFRSDLLPLRDAAARALAEWPDLAASPLLEELIRSSGNPSHRVLALRGLVRLAALDPDPAAAYAQAMDLAERPADKKLILSGLAGAASAAALDLAARHLEEPELQAEAASASIQIAARLRQKDVPRAKAVLQTILDTVRDERFQQQAQEVINVIEEFDGYILEWLVAGPFKGPDSAAVFHQAFPPERALLEQSGSETEFEWEELRGGIGRWDIDLESALGSADHCAAYLKTTVFSRKPQAARLELGSDDAIKAWLNGKLVHERYLHRSLEPRQDIAPVHLEQGRNVLVLKVVDHEGGWAFCCRLRSPTGSALPDLGEVE